MNLLKWHTRLCVALAVLYLAIIVVAFMAGNCDGRFGD